MRVLVVEDDPIIAALVRRGLESDHHAVDHAPDGAEGLELAFTHTYDLILLDVNLPRKNGIDVCRELRKEGVLTPILMLTGLGEDDDIVRGLDAGADDYLAKPFSFDVLRARMRTLLRRGAPTKDPELRVDDLRLDTVSRRVFRGGTEIELTARELALLEYFMRNPGAVITRSMISEQIWDMNFDPQSNVVDQLVKRLRSKIDKGFERPLIETLRGSGYRLRDEG